MIEIDPAYFAKLREQAAKRSRWVFWGAIACGMSTAAALLAGPTDGWPWLVIDVASLMFTLWSRIDQMEFSLLSQVYLGTARSPGPIDED